MLGGGLHWGLGGGLRSFRVGSRFPILGGQSYFIDSLIRDQIAENIRQITASAELPGRTHWDPQPTVSVGNPGSGPPGASTDSPAGGDIFGVFIPALPDIIGRVFPGGDRPGEGTFESPPVDFIPVPVLLPGQSDPGREEWETNEEKPVAEFWDFATSVLGAFTGPTPGVTPSNFNLSGPTGVGGGGGGGGGGGAGVPVGMPGCEPPSKWCYDAKTGKYTPQRRRRRRKMLTAGDMNQLVQIGTLPNNANVRVALAKRIR